MKQLKVEAELRIATATKILMKGKKRKKWKKEK